MALRNCKIKYLYSIGYAKHKEKLSGEDLDKKKKEYRSYQAILHSEQTEASDAIAQFRSKIEALQSGYPDLDIYEDLFLLPIAFKKLKKVNLISKD